MIKKILMPIMMVFMLTGCFYSSIKQPVNSTAIATTSALKQGTVSCGNIPILSIFYNNLDCSDAVKEAMKDGGITKIHHVEKRERLILFGLFGAKIVVTVHGE